MVRQRKLDGGVRGWAVVIAAFFMISIVSGVRRSMGLIFLEIFYVLDAPRSTVSVVISMYFCCSLIGTLFMVLLARKIGTRAVAFGGGLLSSVAMFAAAFVNSTELLILLLGFLTGIGHSCIYIPATVLVSQHFDKRRSLAVGISGSGGAIGAFILPPLLAYAADKYAASGMLMILSGFNLHMLVSAVLLKPPVLIEKIAIDEEEKEAALVSSVTDDNEIKDKVKIVASRQETSPSFLDDLTAKKNGVVTPSVSVLNMGSVMSLTASQYGGKQKDSESFLRQLSFYEVSISTAFISFGQASSFLLTPLLAEDLGINRYDQSVLLLIAGCTDFIFRLATGLAADRFPKHRLLLFCGIAVISASNWMLAAFADNFAGIFSFSFIQGGVGAAYFTMSVIVIADIMGLRNMDMALSCRAVIQAILLLSTPPIMAIIRDTAGQWRYSCWIAPSYCVISILAILRHLRRSLRNLKEESNR